ncbi:TCR/Tet family MFS transporter [Streptomyces sp. SID14478]|uniref:MFS transporter n=1 Tax=Streptomyces sp. SID14478 TaxID=2706073 RepID=UPI0013DB89D8|nr:MFS transporter [Streptomyces sp. SID14478]NEB74749.1 TCR/Tet family MFS transporter [Streptomyces sp. SID14478]
MDTTTTTAPDGGTVTSAPRRRAWVVIVCLTLLNSIGMTVVFPVLPFVTLEYVHEGSLALWIGVLESVNALCAFLVAPLLGGLSDRIGRRPVLIISAFGAAASYAMFGVGGALWVLIAARAVQGFAAGDMPAIFAYVADITPAKDRTKRYGLLGALTGVGMMIGPAIGGALSRISLDAPVYATALIAALVGLVALFALPESLAPHHRAKKLNLEELHPFKVLKDAFARKELRVLLTGFTLISIPFYFYVNNLSVLGKDSVGWGPAQIGLVLSAAGILDIVIQGGLLALLVPRIGERGVVISGIAGQAVGCAGMALVAFALDTPQLLAVAALLFASGQGAMTAALDGLMSNAVGADEQGWLAGGISSIGSAIQMTAPLLAGWLYASTGHATPYALGLLMIITAAVLLFRTTAGPGRVTAAP